MVSKNNINTIKCNLSSQIQIFNNMQESLNTCNMKVIQLNYEKETNIKTYGNSKYIFLV